MTLFVSSVQRFSVGDGPGIRTTVFLKGCNLHCPWCHNPENIDARPQTLTYRATGKTVLYGKETEIGQLVEELAEDTDFYRADGGGVTVSGGEPMLHPESVAELAAALGKRGIPLLVDTAGCVPWQSFEKLDGLIQMYYFDVKTADEDLCRDVIGGDLQLIKSNLQRLVARGDCVHARIPLIPGFNLSQDSFSKMAELMAAAGIRHVDLLPFHRLGAAKYEALGREYAYKEMLPPDRAAVEKAREFFGKTFETAVEW